VNDGPNAEIAAQLDTYRNDQRLRILDFDSKEKNSPGKKAPLSAGILAAQYDWLLLTDGDCVPGSEWIAGMARHAGGEVKVVLGYAPFFSKRGVLNSLQRFDNLLTAVQYLGAAMRGRPYMGVGRNLLYHRSLFRQANGFSKHAHVISGDDDLLIQEVATHRNTTICIEPTTFVYSDAPETLDRWIVQKHRHLSASRLYSRFAKRQNAAFALSWLMFWILLPIVLINGWYWYFTGIAMVLLLWVLCARIAGKLEQQTLTPWYPVLAACYCLLLCWFAVLLTLRPPKTWMRS
jgi:cellulose synthase/poly-beta-1,6-N-acetylglucosamine synthase-like glycosyltransferase